MRDAADDLRPHVERAGAAADALAEALDRVVGDGDRDRRQRGQSRCSSPTSGDSSIDRHLAHREQHAGHEARAVRRHVRDAQRLGDVAEDDLLVGDDARQAHGVDRDLAAAASHQLRGARGGARRRVELGRVVVLDDLGRLHVPGGLGGEAHHQHGADREVRRHEALARARPPPPRAGRRPRSRSSRSRRARRRASPRARWRPPGRAA